MPSEHSLPKHEESRDYAKARTTPFSFLSEREQKGREPFLLAPARSPVLVAPEPPARSFWEWIAIFFGIIIVLVGAWDAFSRVSKFFGNRIAEVPAESIAVGPGFAFPQAPAATSTRSATTSAQSVMPQSISIPSIGVTASIEKVGQTARGEMGAPKSFKDVAWYSLGPEPGEPGNAVFAGHVNNALTKSGVFEHLNLVKPGDMVVVSGSDGQRLTFTVTAREVYPADNAPADKIFTAAGPSQIALVTCDGAWNEGKKTYDKRLVVFATLNS